MALIRIYSNISRVGNCILRDDYDATILHVTSSFSLDRKDPKGGWMIVQLANMLPNIRFVVVCLNNQVKEDELPINIHLWGAAKNREELASLYSAANVTLVLSKRETYSMVRQSLFVAELQLWDSWQEDQRA